MRYDQFRAMFGDMLDPALEEEFKTMQQMGLPTMLINSYGDMGEVHNTLYWAGPVHIVKCTMSSREQLSCRRSISTHQN